MWNGLVQMACLYMHLLKVFKKLSCFMHACMHVAINSYVGSYTAYP